MEPHKKIGRGFELKKHTNLIHCSNNFTLVQRKLFNALLFNAYSELTSKNQFTISAKELCAMIGYKSNDYKNLKKSLLGLMTIAIEWNVINNSSKTENDKWRASSALSSARLEKGVCTYEYSTVMKELFYQPEIYGRIDISLLSLFKSSYGLALYENCIRYYGIPQTPWFSLEVFRKLMGVNDGNYLIFRDLKKRVIDISVKEVNLYSSITIIPEFKRVGSKVVNIRFLIKQKQLKELGTESSRNQEHKDNNLVDLLKNKFSFSDKNIDNVFKIYDLNFINEKINLILNSDSFRLGKIRTLSAYLMEALQKDYKPSESKKCIIQRKQEQESVIQKREANEIQNNYRMYVNATIDSYLAELSTKELEDLVSEFQTDLKNTNGLFYKWYRSGGLKHPAIKALFNNFLQNHATNRFNAILTFDDFKQKNMKKTEVSSVS